ncbi:MAG TPA: DUF924 family protein [Gammaproteobacteria bacterium]|nr:DUF924 family protein [Gammaproteobacteria bacterium]
MPDRVHQLLQFWFGDAGYADLPSSNRTNLWFGESEKVKGQLLQHFGKEFEDAKKGLLDHWVETPRGRLALIILYDQFPRYIYKGSPEAFLFDDKAQQLCLDGLDEKADHALTLVERIFFYMPLVHAEKLTLQESSIRLYQNLTSLSLTETTQVYQLFLAYAYAHFRVIQEFGRFPQRNLALGRISTNAELAFLKNA